MNLRLIALAAVVSTQWACGSSQPSTPAEPVPQSPARADESEVVTEEDQGPQRTELTVDQVAAFIEKGEATLCDANGPETRATFGTIPGALLLASTEAEDVKAILPADKSQKLIFYCSSTVCMAAPKAAEVALSEGYTDVNVLPVGIRGWVAAGQAVDKPAQGS